MRYLQVKAPWLVPAYRPAYVHDTSGAIVAHARDTDTARLIAAAPDMLDVLREVNRYLANPQGYTDGADAAGSPMIREYVERAIAHATGSN